MPSIAGTVRQAHPAAAMGRLLSVGATALALGAGTLAAGVLVPSAATASAATASSGPSVPATPGVSSNITFFRQGGANRYATAAAIAADTFGTSAPTVILTTGASFPDALAAAYLAGTKAGGAPILLTDRSTLSAEASAALTSLHATHVVIVGGTAAVSTSIQTALAAHYQVSRIAGATRYDTAEAVDTQAGAPVGTDSSGQPSAILVSGAGFADALSASALAYARHLPIVLTDPHVLSSQARAILSQDHIAHVVQVGGTGAIAASVTQAVKSMGISVDEVAGANRSQTSTLLATDEVSHYGFSDVHLDLASGTDFADALAGGAHAGSEVAPILLTGSGSDPGSVPAWAVGHCSSLSSADIFGGTGALGASTAQLVGLACPSNGSISLVSGISPVLATSGSAGLVPGPPVGPETLTANVATCGPPGSLTACRVGSGQTVAFSAFASRPGACGGLTPTSGVTDASGDLDTTYSPAATPGTCIVTATANHYSASVAIPPLAVVYPPPPCQLSCCGPIVAGAAPSAIPTCCGPPPCTTQICPYAGAPTAKPTASPAVIACPLQTTGAARTTAPTG
ncbi:MAG: cell wall-binding repeat-containing protein [Acidimicrobiales bacterium]